MIFRKFKYISQIPQNKISKESSDSAWWDGGLSRGLAGSQIETGIGFKTHEGFACCLIALMQVDEWFFGWFLLPKAMT